MNFVVFDTETTGLTIHPDADIRRQPRIIEFGAILTDGKDIIRSVEFICNPGIVIEEIITKITGLTNEVLAEHEFIEDQFPLMSEVFMEADVVIAHNLSFDRSVIEYEAIRHKTSLEELNFPKIECCTVEQLFPVLGRRVKLEELYGMFCGEYEQKHRALDDVKLLHEVCLKSGIYSAFGG